MNFIPPGLLTARPSSLPANPLAVRCPARGSGQDAPSGHFIRTSLTRGAAQLQRLTGIEN